MPTVPYAGENIVQQRALPGARQQISADPSAFGAGMARAGQQLAGALDQAGDVAYQMQQREETRLARDAATKFEADIDKLDSDLRNTHKGMDARPADKPSVYKKFEDETQKVIDKHTKGLSAGARERFMAATGHLVNVRMGAMRDYEQVETDKADNANSEARMQMAEASGARDQSFESIDAQSAVIQSEVYYQARKNSVSKEVTNAKLTERTSRLHANAMTALLNADRTQEAEAYLKRYGAQEGGVVPQMDPRLVSDFQKKLEEHSNLKTAQSFVDALDVGDMTGGLDKIRKTLEGRQEEMAVNLFKERVAERKSADVDRQNTLFKTSYQKGIAAIESGEDPSKILADAYKQVDLPGDLQARLINGLSGLMAAQRRDDVQGNPIGLAELMVQIDSNPEMFKDNDALKLAMGERKLSRAEQAKAIGYRDQKGTEGEVSVTSVMKAAKEMKINVSEVNAQIIRDQIVNDLKREQPGKPVNDLSTRVAGYLVNGEDVRKGDWWWTDMTYVEALKRGKGAPDRWLPTVESDEMGVLKGEMEKAGVPYKDQTPELVRLYKKQAKLKLPLTPAEKAQAFWLKPTVPEAAVRKAATNATVNQMRDASAAMSALGAGPATAPTTGR